MSEQRKIVKFKRRKTINIGVVVFLILFLYIAINVFIYFTKEQLSIYEVQDGTTFVDNRFTALILREEELINSEKAGYIAYYQKDGARVAKNSSIYSISDNQLYEDSDNENAVILTNKSKAEIKREINSFQKSLTNYNYNDVYEFQENIQSIVIDAKNNSLVRDGKSVSDAAEKSLTSGIITYYQDGYEAVTPDEVTKKMFDSDKYEKINLRTSDKISKDTPIYKMITSEIWKLVMPLNKEQYAKLKEKERITFTVLEDASEMTATLSLEHKGTDYYAVLTLDKKLANYLEERYLDIKLEIDSTRGLKIPLTALVEKDFYEVPKEYFTYGGNSKEKGLSKVIYKKGETKYEFIQTEIYYEDEKNYYIDAQLFDAGTTIQAPADSKITDQYTLSKTIKLKGVYNVNQGYSIFKRVEILTQNEEYCIVKDDTPKGLAAYDHIVLDGKTAINQEIIY